MIAARSWGHALPGLLPAKALGLTIPQSVLARADQVIEWADCRLLKCRSAREEGRMGRVLADYVTAIGWGIVGALSMAAGLAILLKVFDWLTPINEWAEIQKGNMSVAIIMAAVILALGIAVGFAIMPVPALRP